MKRLRQSFSSLAVYAVSTSQSSPTASRSLPSPSHICGFLHLSRISRQPSRQSSDPVFLLPYSYLSFCPVSRQLIL